jgi:cytochrome c-type biogenesis protein CcmH
MSAASSHQPASRLPFLVGVALAVAALVAVTASAFAQQPTPSDDQVNAVARQLYCPVCENVPLDVCPTQACAQWRETIREKLALGWSERQIKDYFVAQYGDRVLATPPARGLNWLVYVVPPAAVLAAGFFLWETMRRWQQASAASRAEPTEAPSPESDPYVQRLEDQLKRRG